MDCINIQDVCNLGKDRQERQQQQTQRCNIIGYIGYQASKYTGREKKV